MWTYWYLQEGEVMLAPSTFDTADGSEGPVLHVDSDRPLSDDEGRLVTEEPWGIYVKPDRESVQGGAQPLPIGSELVVDPYPSGTVEPGLSRPLVRGAVGLPASVSRAAGRSTTRRARVAPAPSPPTTSRSSTACGRTSTSPPTPTTATR